GRIETPFLLHAPGHRCIERYGAYVNRTAGRVRRVDTAHRMIVSEYDREHGDQHEKAYDERSTQLPTGTGKIRQKWQPAAEDEGNGGGARKEQSGKTGAEYEDGDEDNEDGRKQQTPKVSAFFLF